MLDDPDDLAILEGVLGLASAFRRQVVAEGVETVEHGQLLLKLGCELGQGYAIARPMPAEKIGDWLAMWRPTPAWMNAGPVDRNDLPVLFAMVDLRAWVAKLKRYLQDGQKIPPALGEVECRLTQWLKDVGRARYTGYPDLERIESIHQSIHCCGQRLVAMKQRGSNACFQSALDEILLLRDELLEILQRLLD